MVTVVFGISTAICWGICDFIGGSQSRRVGAYGMTLGTFCCGLLFMFPAAIVLSEAPMNWSGWLWCMLAGAFDAIGILLLYLSMTMSRLSLAAPVSAITAATLPVLFGILTQGMPKPAVFMGLLLALAAVWMVSQEHNTEPGERIKLAELKLPLLSGSCLGIFLIMMHVGSSHAMLWPMVAVRSGGVATLLLALFTPLKARVRPTAALPWMIIALNALLDIIGNGSYILAGQAGRVDVAAVLSSLYPGATVFMAWLLLKERVSSVQLAGIMTALGAIVLLTL
jgi:drug/metabolite transporter (DMT)-like permease